MRLGRFESGGIKPLGQGDSKKVYADPKNEKRVVAEIKTPEERKEKGEEPHSPRQLKGAYYLTKIAHLLLPRHVPDIYQAGEFIDGQQTIDRERVIHTHAPVTEMHVVDEELERIGLGFNIDENIGNYSKNEKGDVQYLEPFMPWEAPLVSGYEIELLFDEAELTEAVGELKDETAQKICKNYLERIHALFEEEKKELKETYAASLADAEPIVKNIEALFDAFEAKHNMDALFAIKTINEALQSKERAAAKTDLLAIWSQLKTLETGTNISNERYIALHDKYRKLYMAVGTISNGIVDHTR